MRLLSIRRPMIQSPTKSQSKNNNEDDESVSENEELQIKLLEKV
jgi:hypothetical protein